MIKKVCLPFLLISVLLLSGAVQAAEKPGNSGLFLDPAELTGQYGVLVYECWEYTDPLFGDTDTYFAYRYDLPEDLGAFLTLYRQRMLDEYDYPSEFDEVDGQPCLCFGKGNGRNFLFYDYQGFMLLLTPVRFCFAALTPVPTYASTPSPKPEPTVITGGEWRWVTEEVDCPSCVNGVCPICHGMGYITMYGQRIDCDKECPSCNGKGTITQRTYKYFP